MFHRYYSEIDRCSYCGRRFKHSLNETNESTDHIIPKIVFKLGFNEYASVVKGSLVREYKNNIKSFSINLIKCCVQCNNEKSDMLIDPNKHSLNFLGEDKDVFIDFYNIHLDIIDNYKSIRNLALVHNDYVCSYCGKIYRI